MPFDKNHKLGARKIVDRDLDEKPICFKGFAGSKEALAGVPGWQDKLRKYVEILIEESQSGGSPD